MSYSLAVFNKSAFKPHLPASPTVPFWRSWCTATRRLERIWQSLDLTIPLLLLSLPLPWPWGALSLPFLLLFWLPVASSRLEKRNFFSPQTCRGAVYESPKGRWELSAPVIRLSSLFTTLAMNYKYSVSLFLSFPGHGESYMHRYTHTRRLRIPFGLFI